MYDDPYYALSGMMKLHEVTRGRQIYTIRSLILGMYYTGQEEHCSGLIKHEKKSLQ